MEKQPYVRLNFDSYQTGRSFHTSQLVATIRKQIVDDGLLKGCRLPPVRALAHQLGISKNTVQTAYDELKSQGLVESRDRSGLFVAEGRRPIEVEAPVHVPPPAFREFPEVRYVKPNPSDFLSISSVFVDPRILPREKLTACFRSVLKNPGLPEFYEPQGMSALREKIAIRLRDRGMDVESDHVIITNGSQQALDLVARALAVQVVATENPAYHAGKHLFAMNGVKTVGLPINPFSGLDEKEWQRQLAANKPGLAYLTTNFQNPNGYSYTSKEISKIVHWAQEFGFGILEDDWGSEMLSFSEFKPGLRALGGRHVLYMNSFTKKLLPSMRIGYLVANDETIDLLLTAKRISTIAVPALIESALFEFLDRGYYDTHLRNIQEELDIRYEFCLTMLREIMPEGVRWTSPGGGPILWLELPEKVDLVQMERRLRDEKILVQLSSDAFFGDPHVHGFKLGYAFLNQSEMEQGLEGVAKEIRRQLNV